MGQTADQGLRVSRHESCTPGTAPTLRASFDAVYVGGDGNVDITDKDGNSCTYAAVPAGTILPVEGTLVGAGSTATDILYLFAYTN